MSFFNHHQNSPKKIPRYLNQQNLETSSHLIMTCVVCKRSNTKSPLLNFFQSKICGACKASFYRLLKKLHEHLILSIVKSSPTHDAKVPTKVTNYKQMHLVNVAKIEALVWRYLSNPEFCKKKSYFSPGSMCEIECCNYGNIPCQHCRLRRIIMSIKNLSLRTRGFSKKTGPNLNNLQFQVVHCVDNFSKRILQYCRTQLENSINPRKLRRSSETKPAKSIAKNAKNAEVSRSGGKHSNAISNINRSGFGLSDFFLNNQYDPKIALNDFGFYESPLGRVKSHISEIAEKDWMQPHLHNRCTEIKEDNNNGGLADWLSKTNGYTHTYSAFKHFGPIN